MSSVAQEETLGGEMYKVAQYMSSWTYNAVLYPEVTIQEKPLERVFRPGASRYVYVERDGIEKAAEQVLSSVQEGEAVELAAGTGTGKSTAIPVRVACRDEGIGIIIAPRGDMNALNAAYMSRNVAVGRFQKCTVKQVADIHDLKSLNAPAVALMAASDFLMMFAQVPDLFKKIKISYVYIDEAHEHIPQYIMLRILIAARRFEGTRVFFGSATNSPQDMESRIGGVPHQVKSITPAQFPYASPEEIPVKSPAHQSNIKVRTLIFVPGSDCFPALRAYYGAHGLPVLTLPEHARAADTARVMKMLKQGVRPCVVLVTPRHETYYTFDIDQVLDSSVTRDMTADPVNRVIKFVDRISTESEKKQRAGRAGRHLRGVSYYVEPEEHAVHPECIPGTEIYVALWCKLFSVKIDTELYRTWYPIVAPMSINKVALLLVATIHPLMLAPFMDDEGDVAPGTRTIFKNFLSKQRTLVSTSMNYNIELTTGTWQEQVVTLPCLPVDRREYKTDYKTPASWGLWSAVMYHAALGWDVAKAFKQSAAVQEVESDGESDVSSTVSDIPSFVFSEATVAPAKQMQVAPMPVVEESPREVQVRQSIVVPQVLPEKPVTPESVVPTLPEYSSPKSHERVREYVASMRSVESVGESHEVKPRVHKHETEVDRVKRESHRSPSGHSKHKDPDEQSYKSRVSTKLRREDTGDRDSSSYRSSGSTNRSYDPLAKRRTHRHRKRGRPVVDLDDVGIALLDPDDERLLERFWRMVRNSEMEALYKELKDNNIVVSSMSSDMITNTFLKVLCVYNATVSDILQLHSAPDESFVTRLTKKMAVSKLERKLGRIIMLLKVFRTHGLLMRYRDYTPHTGEVARPGSPDHAVKMAELAYKLAPKKFREIVDICHKFVTQLYVADRVVGIGVKHAGLLYMAHHVAVKPGVAPLEYAYSRYTVQHSDRDADIEVRKYSAASNPAHEIVRKRNPRPGERIVVLLADNRGIYPYGWYTITTVGVVCQHSGRLPPGASGAPMIAVDDGCWVGIHVGSTPLPDGDVHGRFTTVVGIGV